MNKIHVPFTNNFLFDRLSDSARQGIQEAICSRGQRVGLLKKTPPASDTLGYPAWMAIMGELNVQRISIGGLMMMIGPLSGVYDEVAKYAGVLHHCVNQTLQNPFEFNLYHYEEHQEAETKLARDYRTYIGAPVQLRMFPGFQPNKGV